MGCLALFAAAVILPPLAAAYGPPPLAIVAAIAAIDAWRRFGPRPLPGLLPGLMAMIVIGQGVAVVVVAIARLAGAR